MADFPEPLTPATCDLQDFKFMPLDVARLRDSDLASDETPECCWAAVLIWCASWHQVPAASVPDNDQWLAKQAGYVARGKVVKEWAEVRRGAMRGWVKCSDGRLYHPVVAEKAIEAWDSKLDQRWRTEVGRIKKHNERHGTMIPRPTFDDWISQGCPQGHRLPVPEDKPPLSPATLPTCPGDVPSETPSKGQEQGQRQGQGQFKEEDSAAVPPRSPSRPKREELTLAKYLEICKAAGVKPVPDDHAIRAWCVDAKIPTDMLQVAWVVFRERYTGDEKLKNKRYKDWPGHFANSVKDRWHGLWFIGDDGMPAWTHTGLQRKQVLDAQQAKAHQNEAAHEPA